MSILATLDQYVSQHIYRYVFAECLKQIVPTEIDSDGDFLWKKDGVLHRKVGPAVIFIEDGAQVWWQNGRIHRTGDKPAIIENGNQLWYLNGKLHRDGNQPAIIYLNHRVEWWVDGIRIDTAMPQ